MIPDDVVERVRTAADIAQVIGEYVPLRRVGTDYRGACPFHGGKNPNFSVSSKRGQYHCFVCHESGDVISFLRKRLSLDFTAAVKLLGEKVGIEVIDTPTRAHAPDPNEPNWEVLAHAAAFFQAQLRDADMGRVAREYLSGRELDDEACARFGIGFAPRDGQLLLKHLATLGFDQERLREAGLLVVREEEGSVRPRFRGRVMFPILDELGRHVGFGGRALGDDTPKYLNSAESGVFQKRRVLYGMHTARQAARRAGRLLVVEGYLDAIRVALGGIEEVVAPLGTALTEEQAALVVRYAPEVFLLYDSDEAGLKATFRSGLELLRHGAAVRVVSLPRGEDPDTFVRARGAGALEGALHDAVDLFDLQVDLLARKGWFADLHHRRRAVDKLLPTIRATKDPITRDLYVARLAEAAAIDRALVMREADEPTPPPGRPRAPAAGGAPPMADGPDGPPPPDDEAPAAPRREWVPKGQWKPQWKGRGRGQGPEWLATEAPPRAAASEEPIERELVRVMLRDRGWVERVAERHGPDSFRDARYAALFAALLAHGVEVELAEVLRDAHPELTTLVESLLSQAEAPSDVEWSLMKLDRRQLEFRMADLQRRIAETEGEEQRALMQEKDRLARERQALLHPGGKGRNPK
jgi:DNA primase